MSTGTESLHHFQPISKKDDPDYEDHQVELSRHQGKSKVFQCTGYGDCKMVFTRSEHLARHMRKHTGEKPFQCVVPGCDRMFSRFDNMMQHTQTHNKSRNGPRRNNKPKPAKRGHKKSTRRSSMMDYEDYVLPSPPPSHRGSSHHLIKEHQIIMPNPKYVELDEDDLDDISSCSSGDYYQPINLYYPPLYPSDSPTLSDTLSIHDYFPTPSRRRSAPQVRYQPYPYPVKEEREIAFIPRRNSVLSELATYLVDHPDQSPENFIRHKTMPTTRRLSVQDLANPIEQLEETSSSMSASTSNSSISSHPSLDEDDGVDLTEDEFQAIQGFGKFFRAAITL
ncbi:Biofilm and cell wall regulator 1 [Choanephora cucurbitarum]|uniref:Biofilm and cell wall regulator 1 n=1 Tax=Choanephora cucurbitarum TaxID=101091 RepID=A0A1C7NJC2_9FUNG|nr:Biofilm and cell wall regulator 1 [Choanephora cucurbitarum]